MLTHRIYLALAIPLIFQPLQRRFLAQLTQRLSAGFLIRLTLAV